MILLPSSRRFLLPSILLLAIAVVTRTLVRSEWSSVETLLTKTLQSQIQRGIDISPGGLQTLVLLHVGNTTQSQFHLPREQHFPSVQPVLRVNENPHLARLLTCPLRPNPHTNHIRIKNLLYNISHSPIDDDAVLDSTPKFNPTILALPPWSTNQYLLVSRVVTEGLHQESLICEANICHHPNSTKFTSTSSSKAFKPCSPADLAHLGPAGGLRCVTSPQVLRIPPTPALRCTGAWSAFPGIPGFHDPRIFWSGKGEPLIIVNSASLYACLGLWIVDLRTLYSPLERMLLSSRVNHKDKNKKILKDGQGQGHSQDGGVAAAMSYPTLTELTRNPPNTRFSVEKNWLLFFAGNRGEEAFVHYDMVGHRGHHGGPENSTVAVRRNDGGRTFAKLIGNGYTTANLTDPDELPCLLDDDDAPDGRTYRGGGHWHQASNALRLMLCSRVEAEVRDGGCGDGSGATQPGTVVNFAVMHRKFSNEWDLPLRYERYFVMWDAVAPFHVLAVSRFPVLFWNETASGWTGAENWKVETEEEGDMGERRQGKNATFKEGRRRSRANGTAEMLEGSEGNVGENWAYFTYTPSIAWAWRPASAWMGRGLDMGGEDGRSEDAEEDDEAPHTAGLDVGYLDDEVIVGVGIDDKAQGFGMAKAETLLSCMRVCSGPGPKMASEDRRSGDGTA